MSPKQKRPAADGSADGGAGSAGQLKHRDSSSSVMADQDVSPPRILARVGWGVLR